MGILVASQRVIAVDPFIYPDLARTQAYDPAPNLTVARGTIAGQIATAGAANDVDTITLNNTPTGGTFTITIANNNGTYMTPALAYNASTAAVQAAVQALANVGAGNATVTGTAGSSYVITGAGALTDLGLGAVTASGALLTGAGAQPTATVVHTTSYAYPGQVKPYASGNSDGSQVPIGIFRFDFSTDANGNCVLGSGVTFGLPQTLSQTIPVWRCGSFREADLVGMDANAVTLLGAKETFQSDGTKLLEIPAF